MKKLNLCAIALCGLCLFGCGNVSNNEHEEFIKDGVNWYNGFASNLIVDYNYTEEENDDTIVINLNVTLDPYDHDLSIMSLFINDLASNIRMSISSHDECHEQAEVFINVYTTDGELVYVYE